MLRPVERGSNSYRHLSAAPGYDFNAQQSETATDGFPLPLCNFFPSTMTRNPSQGTHFCLPYELTAKIFIACLPRDRRIQPKPGNAPLLLAQVCRKWREATLCTPELWRAISFYLGREKGGLGIGGAVATLDLWLSRSAPCSVSVVIISCTTGDLPSKLFTVLAAYSARWERVELDLRGHNPSNIRRIAGSFPRLRMLSILIGDEDHPALIQQRGPVLFPQLSALSLTTLATLRRQPAVLSTSPITALTYNTMGRNLVDPWKACTIFFAYFKHLRHLTLAPIPPDFHRGKYSGIMPNIPELETLCIVGDPHFLEFLVVPSLKSLSVALTSEDDAAATQSFLFRSQCALKHLSITIEPFLTADACLETMLVSSLLSFELVFRANTDAQSTASWGAVFASFLQHPGGVLPALRTLVIIDSTVTAPQVLHLPHRAFLDIAHHFSNTGLERAEYHIPHGPMEDDFRLEQKESAVLKALIGQGLDIRLSYGGKRLPATWIDSDGPEDRDYLPILPSGSETSGSFSETTSRVFRPFSFHS
ncbi:F-box domain-containing protein [Mycena indigotica]|uniref:F-box domain-containing protein n=1 Tax=Mycena indigotica TaxID=2126181 RepID=A0A8H6W931_9AGAR|nr:F-box domain-containing protein [Mycena indigotica]KAF7309302.1 F-box domain-containing protein [Mycena indigotica]